MRITMVIRYRHLVAALLAVGIGVPALAQAEDAGSNVWVGGNLGLSPLGHRKIETQVLGATVSDSEDTATAFQIGGLIEYRPIHLVSVGFAPAVILNVKDNDGNDSGSALDLPLRVTVGDDISPNIRLYGFGTLGYSFVFPPDNLQLDSTPSGVMFGLGGGASLRVMAKLRATAELGYHFRPLSGTENGVDYNFDLNYLTFSAGLIAEL